MSPGEVLRTYRKPNPRAQWGKIPHMKLEDEAVEANALKVWLDVFTMRCGRVALAESGDLTAAASRLARHAAAVADAAERMAKERMREVFDAERPRAC